jgi:hypothetical protein
MNTMPKKGTLVRQIMPKPVVGTVTEYTICQETGKAQVRLVWPDEDGDGIEESRWFSIDQIEEMPE